MRSRWIGFAALAALIAIGGWLVFTISHPCPDVRTSMFSAGEVRHALEDQGVRVTDLRDAAVEARGGKLMRATIGGTGIIAVVWPDATMRLLTDDVRWDRRLTPGYMREALNVSFYALRGGSEAEKAETRVTISRTYRHLDPARPLACQDE